MAPLARPSWSYRVLRSAGLKSHAGVAATRVGVASVAVGVLSVAMGLTRPDWAIVSAVMVLQKGPDRISGSVRGLHRFLGSIAGVGLFAAVHAAQPGPVGVLLVLMISQFFAEVFVPRNYALTCVATTPVVLRTTGARVRRAIGELDEARARIGDGRGAGAGAGAEAGAGSIADSGEILERRRDLQFELHGNQYAAEDAAHDLPEWTARMWPGHLEIQAEGYAALSRR